MLNEYYHWYDGKDESPKLCGSFTVGFLDFLDTLNPSNIIAITENDGIRRVYYRQAEETPKQDPIDPWKEDWRAPGI
jgi:hypothetical protein